MDDRSSSNNVCRAESGSKIPFDIKTKGVLFYSLKDLREGTDFANQFKAAVLDCSVNPNRPDSVVLETITGRGPIYSVIHHEDLVRRVEALMSENKLNAVIIDQVFQKVHQNVKKPLASTDDKWGIVAASLSSSAIDLLLAERYLEETPEFYDFANTMLTIIRTTNMELQNWGTTQGLIEEGFLKKAKNFVI
jgi:hypothetical protein